MPTYVYYDITRIYIVQNGHEVFRRVTHFIRDYWIHCWLNTPSRVERAAKKRFTDLRKTPNTSHMYTYSLLGLNANM